MEEFSLIVLVFVSFPEAILAALVGLSLLGIRPTLKQILLLGSTQAIFGVLTRVLPYPFGVHMILQTLTFSILIYFVMVIPYRVSVLVTLSGFFVVLIVEVALVPLLASLTGISMSDIFNNDWLRVAFFVPSTIILALITLLLRRFSNKLAKYRSLIIKQETDRSFRTEKSFHLISLFLGYNLLVLSIFSLYYVGSITDSGSIPKTLLSVPHLPVLLITVLSIAMMVTGRRVLGLIQDEAEAEAKLNSFRHVEELVGTIRAQRHDFSHHLQVAYGLLEVEAYQEAKQYIKNNVSEIAATLEMVKADNLEITALLYTKSGLAEAKNIKLGINLETSLKQLPLELRDANIILGNLIDNALEAVYVMPVDKRNVDVTISKDPKGYVFEVTNSGPSISPELTDEIFGPDFSTKGEGRGVGLYSVKRLVNKYNGKVQVTNNLGHTSFRVYIPCKD